MAARKPYILHNVSALALPNFGSNISQEAANEQQKEVLFAQKQDFWLYGEKTTEPITELQREHEEHIQYDDYTDSLCVSLLTYMKETLEPLQTMHETFHNNEKAKSSFDENACELPQLGLFFSQKKFDICSERLTPEMLLSCLRNCIGMLLSVHAKFSMYEHEKTSLKFVWFYGCKIQIYTEFDVDKKYIIFRFLLMHDIAKICYQKIPELVGKFQRYNNNTSSPKSTDSRSDEEEHERVTDDDDDDGGGWGDHKKKMRTSVCFLCQKMIQPE
jgi:hypothetical protein